MGHHDLRHDKECQNCGHTVEIEYCSKCGQQNTETRQSFYHLITHMFEDITHYDGNFWKTIKYLLFRPGKLTTEYLLGHRMRYVPPVKLYIFISFVCFFLMALMASNNEETAYDNTKKVNDVLHEEVTGINENMELDTIHFEKKIVLHNFHELDSLQDSRPEDNKIPFLEYHLAKLRLKSKSKELKGSDFIIALAHTLPKVLFIYMPLFAFWLWLLHGKRRWYFFDHGIFTLHYFSFLLLLITFNMILSWIDDLTKNSMPTDILKGLFGFASMFYSFFYFFRSHRRFYGESKAISRIKSFILFIINFFLITITLGITLYNIIVNAH